MKTKRTIVITGAGRGIGLALSKSLYRQDNTLLLVTKTEKSRNVLERSFSKASVIPADLSLTKDVHTVVQVAKEKLSHVDVLINNAGVYVGKGFDTTTEKELDALYGLHLRAPFLLMREFLPLFEQAKHPQVINISSAATIARLPTESIYTATKAGLSALDDVLQKELQAKNIRITTIHPWTVNTHNLPEPEKYLNPSDIASLVMYILSVPPACHIVNVELSGASDWRGSWPPWVNEAPGN